MVSCQTPSRWAVPLLAEDLLTSATHHLRLRTRGCAVLCRIPS
ncbi:hypothetical protein PNF2_230 (plasmid) [Nocardia farcinica IFM 10152]|uniref:Uncharacterized protein n=1 Tax=Nocardia farcinica (strain IFM 10152) TaxID=247156 RepID=Q5YM83_NOCFA|nr:hypothetical protein PNF2_230 [Nocardia farcinica IFM 10152]